MELNQTKIQENIMAKETKIIARISILDRIRVAICLMLVKVVKILAPKELGITVTMEEVQK